MRHFFQTSSHPTDGKNPSDFCTELQNYQIIFHSLVWGEWSLLFLQNARIVIFRRERRVFDEPKVSQAVRYIGMIYLMSLSMQSCSSSSSPGRKERQVVSW